MRKLASVTLCTLVLSAAAAFADHDSKKAPLSPPREAKWSGNGKSVTINYGAPSRRGRAVFGALVPYDKVWRTGANAATTLETTTALKIGGLHVPAGSYSLYTIPGPKEWILIVNKNTGQWGTNYDPKKDLGRVKMKVEALADLVEQLRFSIDNKALALAWEKTRASVPVVVQ